MFTKLLLLFIRKSYEHIVLIFDKFRPVKNYFINNYKQKEKSYV